MDNNKDNEKLYILIAGTRTFADYDFFQMMADLLISHIMDDIVIVSGGANGADTLAERYAKEKGFELVVFPAEWGKYGKSAGYKRNLQMHDFIAGYEKRKCVCFWDGKSKGTQHNFALAKSHHTDLLVFNYVKHTVLRKLYSQMPEKPEQTAVSDNRV